MVKLETQLVLEKEKGFIKGRSNSQRGRTEAGTGGPGEQQNSIPKSKGISGGTSEPENPKILKAGKDFKLKVQPSPHGHHQTKCSSATSMILGTPRDG